MATITPELRQEMERSGDQPVRVEDPERNKSYVLISAEMYDRLRSLFDDSDYDPREAYPLVWKAMKDDWEDPAMDVYDSPENP